MYELSKPPPVTQFRGSLRQVNQRSVNADGLSLLRICAPYFYPLSNDDVFDILGDRRGLGASVTHISVPDRQFRRWSGDTMSQGSGPELPRERYFTLCHPGVTGDGGVLAEELNAYRNVRDDFDILFADLMDERIAEQLQTSPAPYIALIVSDPARLLDHSASLSTEMQGNIKTCIDRNLTFVSALGVMTANADFNGVLDLRQKDAQRWFFETFVLGKMISTAAARFEDILPELINSDLGGSSWNDNRLRLQAIGAFLRRIGILALIYPSARDDCYVTYRHGEPVDWGGWELVLYDGAPAPASVMIDLGGWDTDYPPPVTFHETVDGGDGLTGWCISGVRHLNHSIYSSRRQTYDTPPQTANDDPFAFNAWEVVEECEEGSSWGSRTWYNYEGGETVWYPPHRSYLMLSDLEDDLYPQFDRDEAPYLLKHATHNRFHCMFCHSALAEYVDFRDCGGAFFKRIPKSGERFDRRVWQCQTCDWWLIEMGCIAYADDDSGWSLNETIYVQGALAQLEVATMDAALREWTHALRASGVRISDVTGLENTLLEVLARHFGPLSLERVGDDPETGIQLYYVAGEDGRVALFQIKCECDRNLSESAAAIRTINGLVPENEHGEPLSSEAARTILGLNRDIPGPFALIFTTSTVHPISVGSQYKEKSAQTFYRGKGFFRHKIRISHPANLLSAMGLSRADNSVFRSHLASADFDSWLKGSSHSPFRRFRRLVSR